MRPRAKRKSYNWQPIRNRIWEIDWYRNEWPWPLFRGHLNNCICIAYSPLNIAGTVIDRGLVPNDHNSKWPMWIGELNDHVTWRRVRANRQCCCQGLETRGQGQGQGQGLGLALIQTCNNTAQSKKSCHLSYIVVVMSQISNCLL